MTEDLFNNAQQLPEQRMRELEQEIAKHDRLYYDEDTSEISDQQYDALFRELETLERRNPALANPNSPTQKVGGSALDKFEQREHRLPMLSIDDIFSDGEVTEFYQRLQKLTGQDAPRVSVEPKIDGVAISIIYEDGELSYALTRGDGTRGDDVTRNVRTIRSLTLQLKKPFPGILEVRGEIFMPNREFDLMNERREAKGLPVFANPRNATAGSLKSLDPKTAAQRPLDYLIHGFGYAENLDLASGADFDALLIELGLRPNQPTLHAQSSAELLERISSLDTLRHELDYATDGAVIKLDDIPLRDSLGATSRAPRWAAAFKFPAEKVATQLLNITIQVGRTGVLTPVAELAPVQVSGSTVARATLHNQDEISRKDIRIGDTVIIEKAGEIIPAVVEVVTDRRPADAEPYDLFTAVSGTCPSCDDPIIREADAVAWRCTNFECPAQAVTSLTHFASRKALDIDGLGESVATKLVEHRLALSPLDLFTLSSETLASLELNPAKTATGLTGKARLLGNKRAVTITESLKAAKTRELNRWVYGIGIPQIGASSAKEVSRLHQSFREIAASPIIEKICRINELQGEASKLRAEQKLASVKEVKAQIDELTSALKPYDISPDLGTVAATNLRDWFRSKSGQRYIDQLEKLGIDPQSTNYNPTPLDQATGVKLAGATFVITGTLSKPRSHFADLIEAHGGKCQSSLSKKTNYLLAGNKAGSKLEKAEALEVRILDEYAFSELLSKT